MTKKILVHRPVVAVAVWRNMVKGLTAEEVRAVIRSAFDLDMSRSGVLGLKRRHAEALALDERDLEICRDLAAGASAQSVASRFGVDVDHVHALELEI
jgi:DNA-binding NarL/FixJ family response regulator